MVRFVALASVLVGISAMGVFLDLVGKAPWVSLEARHLREMKDRDEVPDTVEPVTALDVFALPQHRSVAEYSGMERRALALECRVRYMQRASDGDIHLECQAPDSAADRYVTAEITPAWSGRPGARGMDSPGWGFEQLAANFRPRVYHGQRPWGGRKPTRVRITGWLLYDAGENGIERFVHGKRVSRFTDWEIHPVTKIERWDEPLASWVEVRR